MPFFTVRTFASVANLDFATGGTAASAGDLEDELPHRGRRIDGVLV
jgi:hypothetical protein